MTTTANSNAAPAPETVMAKVLEDYLAGLGKPSGKAEFLAGFAEGLMDPEAVLRTIDPATVNATGLTPWQRTAYIATMCAAWALTAYMLFFTSTAWVFWLGLFSMGWWCKGIFQSIVSGTWRVAVKYLWLVFTGR